MKTSKYDAQYFIKKFKAIPENRWMTGEYFGKDKCCALGHCGGANTEEGDALHRLVRNTLGAYITHINDGGFADDSEDVFVEPQLVVRKSEIVDFGSTPKERVLAALELIEAGVTV